MARLTTEQGHEIVNLYHLARTALAGKDDSRYQRMLWATREFIKAHPEVSNKAAYLDLEALLRHGNPRMDQTDVRPRGETEAEFMRRLAGRQVNEMTLQDWLRFMAYEYMAGGERRKQIVDNGLGTEKQRVDYYWKHQDAEENPRKGPIASATGLVDKVYQTVMSPVDALARGADKGFVKAVNNPGPLTILKFGSNGAKPVKKGLTGDQVRAYLEKAGDISQMMVWQQGKQTYPGQDAAAWLSYNNYLRTGKNPAGYSLTIGPRSTSHSTLDSAIRAGTQAARTGMHATFQVTKPGGEVVSFDRTGRRMKGNPRHLTLSGRNGTSPRTVFVDDEEIGTVAKQGNGLWRAVDLAGNDHGDQYTSDFNAAKQLQLGLRKVNPKRNPKDDASVMYESFHGSPSTEVVEIEGQEHYHSNLTSLGVLVELHVDVVTGGKVELEFDPETDGSKTDTVLLCSNEDGTQLFFVGGNQEIDLAELKLDSYEKELVVIGDVSHLVYRTAKDFDDFEETDYIHELSEDSKGPLPELIYDAVNCQLKLAGGCYKITRPLVGTSPGIED